MYEAVPAISASLAADGGADGTATLATNTGFYPGMRGFISDDNGAQAVLIVDLVSTTKIGLRYIVEDSLGPSDNAARSGSVRAYQNAGRTPLAAWTTANHSKVSFGVQVVPVQQPLFNPSFRPV